MKKFETVFTILYMFIVDVKPKQQYKQNQI